MKKFQKKQIVKNIELLYQMHYLFEVCMEKRRQEDAFNILQECQRSAVEIGNAIESLCEDNSSIVAKLENYCEEVYQISEKMNHCDSYYVLKKRLDNALALAKNEIDEIDCGKLEIAFLPYKASMWTALESIWKAAVMDEDVDAQVIPIPYYDLDEQNTKIRLNYEGNLFPEDVPIVDYHQVDMNKWQPDVIYIHNPYDESNNLTRVPEVFYSRNLRERTGCLVYSPYAMESRTCKKINFQFLTPGYRFADKIIVQNEKMKDLCLKADIPENKLVVYGSPKLDALADLPEKQDACKWKNSYCLKNRKVFLLNIHLTYFTGRDEVIYKMHVELLHSIIKLVEEDEEIAMIIRPHPLLREWIAKIYPKRLSDYEELETRIKRCDRCIWDDTSSYLEAFSISDAMLSTFSSLITEYMALNKPVLIIQNELDKEIMKEDVVNYSCNYFRADKNALEILSVENFIKMVKDGKDPLKEERERIIGEDLGKNIGKIGKMIHKEIKDYCERD